MSEPKKTKMKVIEVEGVKLTPGAKYIVLTSTKLSTEQRHAIWNEFDRLLGEGQFTILPLGTDSLKVYEVVPEDKT